MKSIRYFLEIILLCVLLAGCGAAGKAGKEADANESAVSAAETAVEESAVSGAENEGTDDASDEENSESAADNISEEERPDAEEPAEPEPEEPEPVIENISNNEEGHYTFQPHVFGSRYLEEFGEEMRDTFFAYCDAVWAGEDSFPCPDQNSLNWCVGRLSNFFCPPASSYVTAGVCENGVGKLIYLIPKEEFLEKEKEFEEAITGILNDALSDDYTDFEKIIALYEYMTTHYTYDYEMYEHSLDWMDKQSPYRCLTEKQGICCEIAGLYNYLLLQVGIDSEEMGGTVHYSEDFAEGHSWVYVNFNGNSYHIDPTYGLTEDRPQLCYFMMNDAVREERDCFPREDYTLGAQGDQSRSFFTFEASSDKYSKLWEGMYVGLDRVNHEIVYEDWDGIENRFYYGDVPRE